MIAFNLYNYYKNIEHKTEIANFIKVFLQIDPEKLCSQLDNFNDPFAQLFCIFDTMIMDHPDHDHDDRLIGRDNNKIFTYQSNKSQLVKNRHSIQNVIQSILFPDKNYKVVIFIQTKRNTILRIRVMLEKKSNKSSNKSSNPFYQWKTNKHTYLSV